MNTFAWKFRFKAFAIHFSVSLLIALLSALLIFQIWYPWPYRLVAGGQSLFMLLVAVDAILGPGLTFIVFNKAKTRTHLTRDLLVIIMLQIAGLSYGLYSVFLARPIALVYEVDRFCVISQVDIKMDELPLAPTDFHLISFSGPKIFGVRPSRDKDEMLRSIEMAYQGYDASSRPSYWQPYEKSIQQLLERARPLSLLYKTYPQAVGNIDIVVKETGLSVDRIKFLPLVGKQTNWSVLIDAKTGDVINFIHYDGFVK